MSEAAILNADVVSFDVFDTLLTRKTAHPKDVFVIAQELFNERSGYYLGLDFQSIRAQAEMDARQKVSHRIVDITIDDIYHELAASWSFDEKYITALKECELLAEESVITVDPSTRHLYDAAINAGKTIVLISDMYLLRDQVARLLNVAGLTKWDSIIISSEDSVAKFTGSAFAKLIAKYPADKYVHVGDNYISDTEWPRRFNIDTIHIRKNIEILASEDTPARQIVYGKRRHDIAAWKTDLGFVDVQRDIISGLTALYCFDPVTPAHKALGYSFFGPLLLGFVQWLQSLANNEAVEHLHFLARDGAIMQRAYNLYYGDRALPSTYVIGSRLVLNFPAMHNDLFDTDGLSAIVGSKKIDVESVFRNHRLDFNSAEVRAALQRVGLDGVQTVDAGDSSDRLKAALLILKDQFHEASKREAKPLKEYLETIGLMEGDNSLVIDIGWNGSMQHAITSLRGSRIKGAYLGLYNTFKSHRLNGDGIGYFDARIDTKSEKYYEQLFQDGGILMLESLFTNPDHASYVSLKKDKDGTFVGVEGPWDNEESERNKVRDIHDAALQFIEDFKAINLPESLKVIRRDVAIEPLEWIVREPNAEAARVFGYVKYSDVASSVPVYMGAPIHEPSWYKLRSRAKQSELERAFWKEGFLKNFDTR